jgi:Tfp pilus assembly protein PilV
MKRCHSIAPVVRTKHGMTLIEVLLCSVITSFLVLGLSSAVRLSTQSLDTARIPTADAVDTGEALDRLTAELRLAKKFTERTATAITFTVPDQTGDGVDDTIRYAWAGAGQSLTRAVNGLPSPAASFLPNVQAFNMNFLTRTMAAAVPPIVESAEQVLCSFAASSPTGDGIKAANWDAEYFKPTLPANAVSWKITKIRLTMKQNVAGQNFSVVVSGVDGTQKPTGAALETYTASTSTLSASPTAVDIPFSTLAGLSPAAGYSFQVKTAAVASPLNLRIQAIVAPPTVGMSFCRSTDGGASWSLPLFTSAIEYQVYGTVSTQ